MTLNEMITACQTAVGAAPDGQPGPETWTKIYQKLVAQPPAAVPAPASPAMIMACQTAVGADPDGQPGTQTWTKIYQTLVPQAPAAPPDSGPAATGFVLFGDGNHNDHWPPPTDMPAFIHKATEGTFFTDHEGAGRRTEFKARGGKWGWYHFSSGENAADQATHFLTKVSAMGVTPDDLICLDFENSSRHGDRNMTAAEAQQWIDIVEAALGGKVCVYGSNLLTDALQANHAAFPGRPFWPARYSDSPPNLPGNRQWAIWQFTDQGHPYPDMNRFPGTVAELQATWPRLRT